MSLGGKRKRSTRTLMRTRTPTARQFSFSLPDRRQAPGNAKPEERRRGLRSATSAAEKSLKERSREDSSKLSVSKSSGSSRSRHKLRNSEVNNDSDNEPVTEHAGTPLSNVKMKPTARNLVDKFLSSVVQSPRDVLHKTSLNSSSNNVSSTRLPTPVANLKPSSFVSNSVHHKEQSVSSKSYDLGAKNINDLSSRNPLAFRSSLIPSLHKEANEILQPGRIPETAAVRLITLPGMEATSSPVNSTSSSNKNLESRHKRQKVVLDKNMDSVQAQKSATNISLNIVQSTKYKKKLSNVQTRNMRKSRRLGPVPDRASPSQSEDEEEQLSWKSFQQKRFPLSQALLEQLEKKKPMHMVFKVDIDNGQKPSGVRSLPKRKEPAKPPERLPKDVEMLMYTTPTKKRGVTEITDLEVGLTVMLKALRDIRREENDRNLLRMLKIFQDEVTDDIVSMIKKVVSLKQQDKNIRQVEGEIKKKSRAIGDIVDQVNMKRVNERANG